MEPYRELLAGAKQWGICIELALELPSEFQWQVNCFLCSIE